MSPARRRADHWSVFSYRIHPVTRKLIDYKCIRRVSNDAKPICCSAPTTVFLDTPEPLTKPSLSNGFPFCKCPCFTCIQKLLPLDTSEKLDQFCDHPGPTCLMTGPEARTIIAVEIFVEKNVVLPFRICLKFL